VARPVSVSALQLPPTTGGTAEDLRASNIEHALASLDEAGRRGCDIACLPEMFAGYGLPLALDRDAQPDTVPGELVALLAETAKRYRMNLIAPLAALVDGIPRNTAVIISRSGDIVGQYFKAHLTQPELDNGYRAGDDLPAFDMDFGRIGVMTCFDSMFPEVARVLALRGAEIIFFPHVQSGYGEVGWVAQLASRAIDNGVSIVPVSFGVGPGDPWMPGTIMGRSGVLGPDGIWLVSAGRTAGVASAVVDLDEPRWVRCYGVAGDANYKQQTFARRRPELYSALAEPTQGPGQGPTG
jgi:predicted amidohydrolase